MKPWELVRDFQATCERAEVDLSYDDYEDFLHDCYTDLGIRIQNWLSTHVSRMQCELESQDGKVGYPGGLKKGVE